MRRGIMDMSAGNMVYGLFRVSALERAGVYRNVLVPDRLLFTELALYGQFEQVPQVLWFRRWYGRIFSLGRQRTSFFPGGRPLYAYVPWWISHAVSLFWTLHRPRARTPGVPCRRRDGPPSSAFVLAGLLHVWQTLRALRIRILETLVGAAAVRAPRPPDGPRRSSGAEWSTGRSHMRTTSGPKAPRKAARAAGQAGAALQLRIGAPARAVAARRPARDPRRADVASSRRC